MITIAKIYILIFAAFTIAGGIVGYLGTGSLISIGTAGAAGLILLVGGLLISTANPAGLWVSLVACLLLAGRFLPKLIKEGVQIANDAEPLRIAGAWILAAMGPLAIVGAILAAAALFLKR